MKYLVHALLIAGVFLGGDLYANDGRGTDNLLRSMSFNSALQQAKLQSYHVGAGLRQDVYTARPQIAALDFRD